jgi:CMP-N-acetylneuraminic acid synthetase
MRLDAGWLHDFWDQPLPFDRYRRQEVPHLYARNGPAVLAARTEVIKARKSFYGERIAPYFMTSTDSIDIDEPLDLELASWMIERNLVEIDAPGSTC